MIALSFVGGTIEVRGSAAAGDERVPSALDGICQWDPRTRCSRAPAVAYADVVRALVAAKVPTKTTRAATRSSPQGARVHRTPRPYQTEAIEAWRRARGRGVVVLPTGAGKSHVAIIAIDDKRRSALVVAPTLDLVRQWYDLLTVSFGGPVGLVGGGEHDVRTLTVTTYDSAFLHMDHLGARFGMVVFDECHHLPSGSFALSARSCLAPYRLGLTATPERSDGREADLGALIGPTVYRKDIVELSGDYLADYDVERISIELTADERELYESERALYRGLSSRARHPHVQPGGVGRVHHLSSRSAEGRRAMAGYRTQRKLAFAASAKLDYLEHLLVLAPARSRHSFHPGQRHRLRGLAAIFGARHHPPDQGQRAQPLPGGARRGRIRRHRHLEGAQRRSRRARSPNVAVVLSGSGSVREHVQRLGRILRKKEGKRATLYELVTERHRRNLHQRTKARAQCLPLIWSTRAAAAPSST